MDAYNLTLQRELSTDDLGRDRLRRQQGHARASSATVPPSTSTSRPSWASPTSRATSAGRSSTARVGGYGARLRPDHGHRYLCNCRTTATTRCRPSSPSASPSGYSLLAHYTFQRHKNHDGGLVLHRPRPRVRRAGLGPHAHVHAGHHRRAAVRQGQEVPDRRSAAAPRSSSAAGRSTPTSTSRAACPSTSTTATPARTATRAPTGPNLIGDITDGRRQQGALVQRDARSGRPAARSAGRRAGTFGDMERGSLHRARASGTWTPRSSSGSTSREHEQPGAARRGPERLQPREPGQPRHRRSACPATTTPTRAASPSTAPNWQPRNLQFAREVPVLAGRRGSGGGGPGGEEPVRSGPAAPPAHAGGAPSSDGRV